MWGKKIGKNRHEGIRCELPTVSQSAPRWSGTPDVAAVVAGIGRANQQCRRRMSAVDEQSTNGKAHQCDNTWRVRCGLCGRRVCWHCGLHTTPPVAKTHNSFEDVRFHTFIRSPSKKKPAPIRICDSLSLQLTSLPWQRAGVGNLSSANLFSFWNNLHNGLNFILFRSVSSLLCLYFHHCRICRIYGYG